MPRTTRKQPIPKGICRNGTKDFQGLIPCSRCNSVISTRAFAAADVLPSRVCLIISARRGVVMCLTLLILAEVSAAPNMGLSRASRINRPVPTILAHHGRPDQM